jgi:hypothetical protein
VRESETGARLILAFLFALTLMMPEGIAQTVTAATKAADEQEIYAIVIRSQMSNGFITQTRTRPRQTMSAISRSRDP